MDGRGQRAADQPRALAAALYPPCKHWNQAVLCCAVLLGYLQGFGHFKTDTFRYNFEFCSRFGLISATL